MNRRELAFCTAYVIHRNAQRAAIEAGYTKNTANVHARKILARPHVQEQINSMIDQISEKVTLDAAKVIDELGAIALTRLDSFLREVYSPEGKPVWTGISPDELTEQQRAAVKDIEVHNVYVGRGKNRRFLRQEFRYTLHDKMAALQMLGKHFDVFGEQQPKTPLGQMYEDMPQEELEKAMSALEDLREKAAERQRDREAIDGKVLPND